MLSGPFSQSLSQIAEHFVRPFSNSYHMHCYQYFSVGVVITFRCCDTSLSLASRSMCQYTPLIFNLGTRGTGADSAFGVSPYVMLVGLLLF